MIRPLICDAAQVRALLAGATRVRVPCKVQPSEDPEYVGGIVIKTRSKTTSVESFNLGCYPGAAPFAPGDVLSVREAWADGPNGRRIFKANFDTSDGFGSEVVDLRTEDSCPLVWRSASTMPLSAVRINRPVLRVRCERVSEISPLSAITCGARELADGLVDFPNSATKAYGAYWRSRYGKRYPWESAWCWVIDLEGVTR